MADEILDIAWPPLTFRGLAGTAGLPRDAVDTLSTNLKEITEDPAFPEFMYSQGFSIAY